MTPGGVPPRAGARSVPRAQRSRGGPDGAGSDGRGREVPGWRGERGWGGEHRPLLKRPSRVGAGPRRWPRPLLSASQWEASGRGPRGAAPPGAWPSGGGVAKARWGRGRRRGAEERAVMERRGAGAAAAAAVGRRLLWALPAYAAGLLGLGAGALLLALALYAGWRRRRRARQRALSLAARLHSDEEAAVRAAAAGLGAARGELPAWVSGARGGDRRAPPRPLSARAPRFAPRRIAAPPPRCGTPPAPPRPALRLTRGGPSCWSPGLPAAP